MVVIPKVIQVPAPEKPSLKKAVAFEAESEASSNRIGKDAKDDMTFNAERDLAGDKNRPTVMVKRAPDLDDDMGGLNFNRPTREAAATQKLSKSDHMLDMQV